MQFDHFDNKVREAADHHHPAYDEHAWKKMKSLLDRHMPEKDDRRRRIAFLIPLFLLLGGGTWFFIGREKSQFSPAVETLPAKPNSPSTESGQPVQQKDPQAMDPVIAAEKSLPDQEIINPGTGANTIALRRETPVKSTAPHRQAGQSPSHLAKGNEVTQTVPENATPEDPARKEPQLSAVAEKLADDQTAPSTNVASEEVPVTSASNSNAPVKTAAETLAKVEEEKTAEKKKPARRSLASRFFLFGSAGPDLSFTREAGEVKPVTGLGTGFEVNDRFTVRAGFFTARKVYSAKPDEYDPPANFWNYYPNMQKIDANCKVYEIPLLVSYQFGRTSKRSWMATAGVSSYFMKEEKYTYFYKPTSTAPITSRSYTISNRFEHHFSVLTLSGGYKRKLSDRITVMAEPYVKLPLSGIGFGNVNLNSAGVMFSVGIRPFGK